MSATIDRLSDPIPSSNGAPKPRGQRKPAASPARPPSTGARQRAEAARRAVAWSHRYTAAAVVLSSGLNAHASCTGDGPLCQVAGAALGAAVPCLVWCLARVSTWTYRAGWRRLALVSGAVACALLALSVTHCATAFAALTGTGPVLAGCLAVGIDCGLVASEATGILVQECEP